MSLASRLLVVSESEKKKIYEIIGITKDRLDQALNDLMQWYEHQPHLPREKQDLLRYEKLYATNRMSIEKVKMKIDYQYTIRNFMPEFFNFERLLQNNLLNIFDTVEWIVLPKLSDDFSRVTLMRMVGNTDNFNLEKLINFQYLVGEFRLICDYALKDRYILDLENFKTGHLIKINPVTINKSDIANKKAYGMHLAGIHIVNAPSYVDKLIAIFKQTLKPKLAARIIIHDSYKELYAQINQKILPKEYGGSEKQVSEIVDDWKKELLSDFWKEKLLKISISKSDESKRQDKSIHDELFGVCGSFRKLDLD